LGSRNNSQTGEVLELHPQPFKYKVEAELEPWMEEVGWLIEELDRNH
jgi:hypothetical protein